MRPAPVVALTAAGARRTPATHRRVAALAMLLLLALVPAPPLAAARAPAQPVVARGALAARSKPRPLATAAVARTPASVPAGGRALADRYLVLTANRRDAVALIREHRGAISPRRRYRSAVTGFAATMDAATADRLRADPRVVALEADRVMGLGTTQASPTWGLDRLDQSRLPLSRTYTYTAAANSVTAYVVDSGVYAGHREFGSRVRTGFDAVAGRSTRDCNGHGTHVAATIAGRVFGVAKEVRIVPVRVTGCDGRFPASTLVTGLDFVARHHRRGQPAVANLSLGGGVSRSIDAAVNRLIDDGVTVVVAAGNEAYDSCYVSPARVGRAITVGASNRRDAVPFWSNFGRCLDLFAPGVAVTSAGIRSRTATATMDGTSMAAPHVAGAAARYLAAHPAATPRQVAGALRSNATTGVLGGYPGPGSPNKLLHVRAAVPVVLTSSASAPSVEPGTAVTVRGALRNAVSGTPVSGKAVALYRRPSGTTSWSRVTTGTTGGDGLVTFPLSPQGVVEYQLRHQATTTTTGDRSGVDAVDARATTTLATAASASQAPAGSPVTLSGTLSSSAGGAAVADGPVDLYVRPQGADWSWVAGQQTDVNGAVSFEHTPPGSADYQLRHPATSLTRASDGAVLSVEVTAAP